MASDNIPLLLSPFPLISHAQFPLMFHAQRQLIISLCAAFTIGFVVQMDQTPPNTPQRARTSAQTQEPLSIVGNHVCRCFPGLKWPFLDRKSHDKSRGLRHFGFSEFRTFRMSRREPPSLREMVPISSLKEEGDLQSGYLVLDMAEIGTKLDFQSSPTAPPVNTKAMYPVWILIFAVLFRGLGQGPNKLSAGQRDRRRVGHARGTVSCVYDSPPRFGAEPQQAVDPL
ncbi:hypothetical protein C8J57DRAFT_1222764 [Mycena rebaudengoi]|nr:hypothetical protein C8J57DRAFT_1222764 [Mycena rebaudengoi]